MPEKITVITPTGDRPLAFSLCQRWMKAQTRQPDQWLVIDDGQNALQPDNSMQYIRRKPRPNDPKFTLAMNLRIALPLVKGDLIIIMEDDEYYAPGYIEAMVQALETHIIAGIMNARYYHLPTGGYYRNHNDQHASLAETAFRQSVLPILSGILENSDEPFIDIKLWKEYVGNGNLFDDSTNPLYLGIKGLPGRKGIGGGHKPEMYRNHRDSIDRDIFKAWVPKDWQVYADILSNTTARHVPCDIIVPTYEQEALTVACFESIKQCTKPETYRIIWVDNGSKNTAKAEHVLEGTDHIIVRLSRNIGFVGAVNRGISVSNSDFVCLLNNDTVVSSHWLEKLIRAFDTNPKLGIVGPLTAPLPIPFLETYPPGTPRNYMKKDYDSHHNIRYIEDTQYHRPVFPEYTDLENFNRQLEIQFPQRLENIRFVAFLCAVIRRKVIDQCGLLDINYEMGMYDDNDYHLAIMRAGWQAKILWDTCIIHHGHQTFRHINKIEHFDDNSLRLKNLAYMNRKWGLK